MNTQTANQMSMMNLLLTALIIAVSLYLITYINSSSSLEGFKEGCDCEAANQNQLRNEQIKGGLGNKDVDTVFGTPVAPASAYSKENTQENAPDIGGGKKSLFLFKHNKCTPECCAFGKGTDASCSGGCVCYNKEQNVMVSSRGDGAYPQTHESKLTFTGDKILNDKYSN